ncbi:MAG: trigger factor [Eubacteriales bacterium]|jgi:trigger factor
MALKHFEKKDTNTVELVITVPKAEFDAATEKAYKKNVKNISVPGFRKGKAPRKMIEKLYGEGVFFEDAVNICYPDAYAAAVEEAGIEPVDRASVDIEEINDDGLTIKATVTVKPEVELTAYKGLKAEKVLFTVSDEEIDSELKRYQMRNSRQVTVDRAAEMGDTVTLNYSGSVDGEKFEGGTAENQTLKLGSGQFIPGFEEQLVGYVAGQEGDVKVTFPEEYHAKELAGKDAVFACKVLEVKTTEMDEIDDEFAKDVSEFDTLEEFKADIRRKLQENKDKGAQNMLEDALITEMLNNTKVEVPQCMIESELDDIARDMDYRMQMQGMNLDMYLQYTGSTMDMFRKSFADQADRRVRTRLALEKIAALENIQISDEAVEEEYKKLSEAYNVSVDQCKMFVSPENLRKDLAVAKAVELVKDSADVAEITAEEYEARQAALNAEVEKAAAEAKAEEAKTEE